MRLSLLDVASRSVRIDPFRFPMRFNPLAPCLRCCCQFSGEFGDAAAFRFLVSPISVSRLARWTSSSGGAPFNQLTVDAPISNYRGAQPSACPSPNRFHDGVWVHHLQTIDKTSRPSSLYSEGSATCCGEGRSGRHPLPRRFHQ